MKWNVVDEFQRFFSLVITTLSSDSNQVHIYVLLVEVMSKLYRAHVKQQTLPNTFLKRQLRSL